MPGGDERKVSRAGGDHWSKRRRKRTWSSTSKCYSLKIKRKGGSLRTLRQVAANKITKDMPIIEDSIQSSYCLLSSFFTIRKCKIFIGIVANDQSLSWNETIC